MTHNTHVINGNNEFIKRVKARQAMKNLPIHNFDIVGKINGYIKKQAVRCEGVYLEKMYYDLMSNPNNNYITCIDELLYNDKIDWQTFKNTKISSLLKESDLKDFDIRFNCSDAERSTKAELICSRLANMFNIKTEYVAPIKDNPYACIIIDFLKGNESIQDFREFTQTSPPVYSDGPAIKVWIESLTSAIIDKVVSNKKANFSAYVIPMVTDFTKQYIFKKYVVHDSDLCSKNISIVLTPNNEKLEISPMYDYERCLCPGIRSGQAYGIEEDIQYLVENYPTILKSIIHDFTLTPSKKQYLRSVVRLFEPLTENQTELINLVENSSFNFVTMSRITLDKENMKFTHNFDK